MVASNPLFRNWSIKKFNATVINDIWPEVFFFTLIATMVSTVTGMTSHSLVISNQLLTVLGTVLGLVISFRTSSAYERYQDGRKLWSNITIASRNIAQMIWIHVPSNRPPKDGHKTPELNCLIEKKSMVNLTQAFSVSVKHFLRGEPGIYYQDLYPLVCFLPRYATPTASQVDADMLPLWRASEPDYTPFGNSSGAKRSMSPPATLVHKTPKLEQTSSLPTTEKQAEVSEEPAEGSKEGDDKVGWYSSLRKKSRKARFDPERALPSVSSDVPLKPSRNPPAATIYDYFPLFRIFKPIIKLFRRKDKDAEDNRTFWGGKKAPELVDSNVPLEITIFISNYLAWLLRNGLLTPAMATGMTNNINMLQDTLTNLERIRNTPLPFAYQAHLRMSLWLYLFFLPFQIQSAFKYLTIPATAFASFLLLGFLEIGQEIENPFNYDLNDLDLDHFCLSIQRELAEITAHTSPDPEAFIFTPWNQPFAPADRRSAQEIISPDSDDPNHTHEYYLDKDDTDKGLPSIRRTLLKSWREVDEVTRRHA